MNMRINAVALMALGVLAACTRVTMFGHPVKADTATPAAPAAQSMITRLIIDYTPSAAKQTTDDPNFNGAALRKAISDGLAAQGLLNLDDPAVVRVAAIEVDEFDVRATSNMVLMGRVASAGVLGGSVRIRDGSGAELRQFHVRADMPMNIVRSGADRNALENLYKGFTGLLADSLTGKVRESPAQPR